MKNPKQIPGMTEALKQMVNALKYFRPYGDQMIGAQQMLSRYVELVQPEISKMLANLTSIFSDVISPILVERLVKIKYEQETADVFIQAGWPLSPSIPYEIRQKVIEFHTEGKQTAIGNVIRGYFRKDSHQNTITMAESWGQHPLFAPRMKIINDALEMHSKGKYTLSVPTLLPLVEGILTEYVIENNLSAKIGKVDRVYKAAIGDFEEHMFSTWAIAQVLSSHLGHSLYGGTDLDREWKKSEKSRKVNRHTILHGASIDYDSYTYSLKQFLILDAIYALEHPLGEIRVQ